MATLSNVRRLLKSARDQLSKKENVVATGVGYKVVNGKKTSDLSIICSVSKKLSKAQLTKDNLIPEEINGIPTDINPTGIIRAQGQRPAFGGSSIGHFKITAGTLGCVVKKGVDRYILSNNHVLANSNDAQKGDLIYQPGPYDGGTENDAIGELLDFIPIKFSGEGIWEVSDCLFGKRVAATLNFLAKLVGSKTILQAKRLSNEDNLVDCALAAPYKTEDVSDEIIQIGKIMGIGDIKLDTVIQKYGRTTKYTEGIITQIDVTVKVDYDGKVALFRDQIMAGAMSRGGDSGSVVLDKENKIIGLLFAGSDTTTIINKIDNVFSALGVGLL